MVSLEKAKDILNKNNNYSEEEIKQILELLNPIVEILVDYVEFKSPKGKNEKSDIIL